MHFKILIICGKVLLEKFLFNINDRESVIISQINHVYFDVDR